MAHGWAATNKFSGLAAAAFTWSNGATTNREYLNDGRMSSRMSVGSGSPLSVIVDAGSAITLNSIAVLNSTIGILTTPTVAIEGADNAGISTNLVTKVASAAQITAPRHKDHVFAFPAATRRYWRITFAWSGLQTLYIGELYGAELNVLSRGVVYGDGERESYATTSMEMDAGDVRSSFLAGPYRTKRLPFADLTDAQRDEVAAAWRAGRGGATPVLWAHNVNLTLSAATLAEQDVLWGKATAEFGWTSPDFNLSDVDAVILRSIGREVGA